MRDELFLIHSNLLNSISMDKKRHLYNRINWDARGICIAGARGTGKTTLILQHLTERYDRDKCLYVSGDNINIIAEGLFNTAKDFFAFGGETFVVDEVHKYPDWSQEVKNIYDSFPQKSIIISGSSTLDLTKARYDLSRRVVYYRLEGLSFREFLKFEYDIDIAPLSLEEIVKDHVSISSSILKKGPVLKYFNEYLEYGYYPYFLEGKQDYNSKVMGAVEKVLFEDIGIVFNLPVNKIPAMKKLLWLVATSHPFTLNIERIATDLGITRPTVYNYLEILENADLFKSVKALGKGAGFIRKPGKLYFENTNLLLAIAGSVKIEAQSGTLRETFFVNQLSQDHKISLHEKCDFVIDEKYHFEIGGPSKKEKQISGVESSYLAIDGIETGFQKRIPLYLFGFLY
ncbi:MAG TPA: AAA family ATPase [bacterium]|nr:AAA family ATPase [bacterium]HQM83460.1 AAA family ATPase [bacterium]